MPERWFTPYQVSELLGETAETVIQWIRDGDLPIQRIKDGSVRITGRALKAFLEDRGMDLEQIFARPVAEDAVARDGAETPAEQPQAPGSAGDTAVAAPANDDAPGSIVTPEEVAALTGDPPAAARRAPSPPPLPRRARPPEPPARPAVLATPPTDPAEQVADALLGEMLRTSARELHLDPARDGLHLRLRTNGSLHEKKNFPSHLPEGLGPRLIESLKSMANLDGRRNRPQRGTLVRALDGGEVRLALSTCPTVWGEKVFVERVDPPRRPPSLAELGLPADAEPRLRSLLASPGAMVVVAGPPRSGKSATLLALAAEAARPERNVATVERRPRTEIPGAVRSRIDPAGGFAYADALRAFEDHNADVILIEDLRDPPTALGAIESARDGRVILAGMIAADAAEAVAQLLAMGAEPWALASTLSAVIEQPPAGPDDPGAAPRRPAVTFVEGDFAAAIRAGGVP